MSFGFLLGPIIVPPFMEEFLIFLQDDSSHTLRPCLLLGVVLGRSSLLGGEIFSKDAS